jgi:uncharacterized protein (TIGR02246 family)
MNTAEAAVADVIVRHQHALNTSDTNSALALYAPDGVFMPPHCPSIVGASDVRKVYERVFEAITLRLEFTVSEIRQVSPEWVFARTCCSGTSTRKDTGVTSQEGHQELVIFQKVAEQWKIARYCFSTTLPPESE